MHYISVNIDFKNGKLGNDQWEARDFRSTALKQKSLFFRKGMVLLIFKYLRFPKSPNRTVKNSKLVRCSIINHGSRFRIHD